MKTLIICSLVALAIAVPAAIYVAHTAQTPVPETVMLQGTPVYTVETQDCPTCRGTGVCALCGGAGTLTQNGQTVACPKECAACGGTGTLTLNVVDWDWN